MGHMITMLTSRAHIGIWEYGNTLKLPPWAPFCTLKISVGSQTNGPKKDVGQSQQSAWLSQKRCLTMV